MATQNLTSIIMTCYDQTQTSRHVSMLAAANITRYTNPEEYQLIIVDAEPKYPFRDDYHVLKINRLITLAKDPGYYACMNKGAEEANGKYLCFIENDVFVNEGWLPKLRWYLENYVGNNKMDVVLPDQIPCTRADQVKMQRMSYEEALGQGRAEQGLVLMTRRAFNKIGGWDRKLKKGYGWKRFYQQIHDHGLKMSHVASTTISHITGMSYYDALEFDPARHAINTEIENSYLNKV